MWSYYRDNSSACLLRRRPLPGWQWGVPCMECMLYHFKKSTEDQKHLLLLHSVSIMYKPSSSGLGHETNRERCGYTICNEPWKVICGESVESWALFTWWWGSWDPERGNDLLQVSHTYQVTQLGQQWLIVSKTEAEMETLRKWQLLGTLGISHQSAGTVIFYWILPFSNLGFA